MKKFIFIIYLFTSFSFADQNPHPFTSIAETKRFDLLTKEIRCLVCQNQSLADSNAPLAIDLRNKIHNMIVEKKSNDEIKDYFVKRYGEFVLLKPNLNKTTFLLWSFPFLALLTIFILLSRIVKTK